MTQDVETRFLEVIHEVDEGTGRARVRHEQEHLGPPELDVVFAGVEEEQVFPHLERECVGHACRKRRFEQQKRVIPSYNCRK